MEATSHVAGWNEGRETNNDSASHLGGGGEGEQYSLGTVVTSYHRP